MCKLKYKVGRLFNKKLQVDGLPVKKNNNKKFETFAAYVGGRIKKYGFKCPKYFPKNAYVFC